MAFREAVLAETQHLLIDAMGEILRVAVGTHAVEQLVLEMIDAAAALPGAHRTAQRIGFAGAEAGRNDRDLHHLLLEDGDTERALQDLPDLVTRIRHRLLEIAASQVGMHHVTLNRARAHDRDLDHQVVVLLRPQPRQHRHLRA